VPFSAKALLKLQNSWQENSPDSTQCTMSLPDDGKGIWKEDL
jgi:hypothetical protein